MAASDGRETGAVDAHRTELPHDPVTSLRHVARTAEAWGGEWQAEGLTRGRLSLPVTAGLRFGRVAGTVSAEATAEGSRLTFAVEERAYQLRLAAVFTLLIAAAGALVTVIAPFFPRLAPLIPVGIVLALAAWLLIVARLQNSGPEEFFAAVADFEVPEPRLE